MKLVQFIFFLVVSYSLVAQDEYDELFTDKKSAYCVTTDIPGQRVFAGTQKGHIVEINNEEETLAIFQGEKDLLLSTAVSPENNFLITGAITGAIDVWDLSNPAAPIKNFIQHEEAITSLTFNSNGNILIASCADGTISIWDIHRGSLITTLKGHKKAVSGVSLHRSETKLASSSYDGTVKVWDLSTYQAEKTLDMKGGKVRSVAYSYDGKHLAVGMSNKTIRVLDATNYSSEYLFMGHKDVVYQVAFSYDDHYLISGSQDNTVRLWSMENGQVEHSFNELANFVNFSLHPDGASLYIADMTPVMKVWDLSSLELKGSEREVVAVLDQPIIRGKEEIFEVNRARPKVALQGKFREGEVFETLEKELNIEGNLVAENKLYKLEINDVEIPVKNYHFNYKMKLAVGKTTIKVNAIDIYNNETTKEFVVHRSIKNVTPIDPKSREGRDYALVIATDEFDEYNNLTNPIYDARSISKSLAENYNFTIDTLFNPTKIQVYKKLREYSKKVFSDDDQLFVFFAGHGEFDELFTEGYLVAKDSKKEDEEKISFIAHSNLRTIINHIPCKHIFVTMDVCFGGTFDQRVAQGGSQNINNDEFITTKLQYTTRQYLTSGGKEYVPDGRPGHHSPFATEFIKALDSQGNTDKVLTISEISQFVEHVKPVPQTGSFGKNEQGSDFLFINKK